jgi:hypothetical protein
MKVSPQEVPKGASATFLITVTAWYEPLTGVDVTDPLVPSCNYSIPPMHGSLVSGRPVPVHNTHPCQTDHVDATFVNQATVKATTPDKQLVQSVSQKVTLKVKEHHR